MKINIMRFWRRLCLAWSGEQGIRNKLATEDKIILEFIAVLVDYFTRQ